MTEVGKSASGGVARFGGQLELVNSRLDPLPPCGFPAGQVERSHHLTSGFLWSEWLGQHRTKAPAVCDPSSHVSLPHAGPWCAACPELTQVMGTRAESPWSPLETDPHTTPIGFRFTAERLFSGQTCIAVSKSNMKNVKILTEEVRTRGFFLRTFHSSKE